MAKFLNDVITTLKMFFNQIRAIVLHFLLLYNRYFPEVLFGKCLGNYLVATYPEHAFYEYPLIIFMEIYASITTRFTTEPPIESTELSTELSNLNVEQNEISNSDLEDSKRLYGAKSQIDANSTEISQSFESFFDFSSVLGPNKDEIIQNAANEQSWQICLKLYTAESISRSLKIYFLGL